MDDVKCRLQIVYTSKEKYNSRMSALSRLIEDINNELDNATDSNRGNWENLLSSANSYFNTYKDVKVIFDDFIRAFGSMPGRIQSGIKYPDSLISNTNEVMDIAKNAHKNIEQDLDERIMAVKDMISLLSEKENLM